MFSVSYSYLSCGPDLNKIYLNLNVFVSCVRLHCYYVAYTSLFVVASSEKDLAPSFSMCCLLTSVVRNRSGSITQCDRNKQEIHAKEASLLSGESNIPFQMSAARDSFGRGCEALYWPHISIDRRSFAIIPRMAHAKQDDVLYSHESLNLKE